MDNDFDGKFRLERVKEYLNLLKIMLHYELNYPDTNMLSHTLI